MTTETLSRTGLIEELSARLRKSKSSISLRVENQLAMDTLDRLAGNPSVSPEPTPPTRGIDLFVKFLIQDYQDVIAEQPQLQASVNKFIETVKAEIAQEATQIENDYRDLPLNLEEDPYLVTSNEAERSLMNEALQFLKFNVTKIGDGTILEPRYVEKSRLPLIINVGLKNLLRDVSPEGTIRRPVIRKIVALANYRAKN